MNRTNPTGLRYPECPIRNILARLCDKWSLLVIHALDGREVLRFGELMRELPDISQKMLTVTLRTLEEDGLVLRTAYPEIPPRVEYRLTERARTLLPHLHALFEWADRNRADILESRNTAKVSPGR